MALGKALIIYAKREFNEALEKLRYADDDKDKIQEAKSELVKANKKYRIFNQL